jgi:hypothetical protein
MSSQFIVLASSRPSAILVTFVAAVALGADGGSHLGWKGQTRMVARLSRVTSMRGGLDG